jgi:hypothetical protein
LVGVLLVEKVPVPEEGARGGESKRHVNDEGWGFFFTSFALRFLGLPYEYRYDIEVSRFLRTPLTPNPNLKSFSSFVLESHKIKIARWWHP